MDKKLCFYFKIIMGVCLISIGLSLTSNAATVVSTHDQKNISQANLTEREKLSWLQNTLAGKRFDAGRVASFLLASPVGGIVGLFCTWRTLIILADRGIADWYIGKLEPYMPQSICIFSLAFSAVIHNTHLKYHGVNKTTSAAFFLSPVSAPFYALCHELFLGYHKNLQKFLANYLKIQHKIPVMFKSDFDKLYQEYVLNNGVLKIQKKKQIIFVAQTLKKIKKALNEF